HGSNQSVGVPSFCGATLLGLPATYGPGTPLTKVQPAVVPDVRLEKLRLPPTQSGSRSWVPEPGLPLSLTFDPLRTGVKGVPVTIIKIPVACQPPNTEETILLVCRDGRAQRPFTVKLCVWFRADKPRSALVFHNCELAPSVW